MRRRIGQRVQLYLISCSIIHLFEVQVRMCLFMYLKQCPEEEIYAFDMTYCTKGAKNVIQSERKVPVQLSEVEYRLAWKIVFAVLTVTVSFRNDLRGQGSHNATQSVYVWGFSTSS